MIAIKLLLADEYCLMRAALREQFTQAVDLYIVTEASSLDEVLHLVQHQPPDIALIDIEMIGSPPINVQQIGALCAATAVIFLSQLGKDLTDGQSKINCDVGLCCHGRIDNRHWVSQLHQATVGCRASV